MSRISPMNKYSYDNRPSRDSIEALLLSNV